MRKTEEQKLRLPSPGRGPADCRRCDLWRHATQAVLGEGPKTARIMLVGEQPGDEEDLRGKPLYRSRWACPRSTIERCGHWPYPGVYHECRQAL
jgi:hypothetical protein